MKKILFLHCPGYDNSIKLITYGLFILGDILKKNGYSVEIIHLGLFKGDIIEYIKENKIDYICISLFWFYQLKHTIDICLQIKKELKTPIIMGGITASYYKKELEKLKIIDYIIVGDGEYKLVELLNKLSNNNNKIIDFHIDYLNFSLLKNYEEYLKYNYYSDKEEKNIFYLNFGKGCENICPICSGNKITTKKLYGRDKSIYYHYADFLNSVINGIKKYNLEIWYISFHTKENEKIYIDIFRELKNRGIKIKVYFESFFIPSYKFLNDFSQLVSDDSIILISPETGDEDLRKQSRTENTYSNKDFYTFLELSKRLGVNLHISFSVGLPNDSIESFKKTLIMINYIKNNYKYNISASIIDIEPGSLTYEAGLVDKKISSFDDFIEFKMGDIGYDTKNFTQDELKKLYSFIIGERDCSKKVSNFLSEIIKGQEFNVQSINEECKTCNSYKYCFNVSEGHI